MAAKAIKLSDDHPGSFTKTVKHTVLCCGNIEGNNNKFYSIEIQQDPGAGKYRVFTHYGRINTSNVYDMRGPWSSLYEAESEFDSIVKKKLRGKNIKEADGTSRRENYELVELVSPTVGSPNVRGKATASVATQVSAKQIINEASKFDPDVQRLIDQFAQENIHKITSLTGSSITLTANGLETALGPVTMTTINDARRALNDLKDIMDDGGRIDPDKEITRLSNNFYYSKIPHNFGRKITKDDWIITDAKLVEEYDLLDQLAASVQMGITTNTNASKQLSGFDTDIEPIDKKTKVFKDIVDIVESTKKHSHLTGWRVKNAYLVKIGKERKRYEKAEPKFGNVQEFFHGSQNANILSILLGGLIIPPVSAGHVTGRMFGNGIYGANSSTKSLNYSVGGWSGRRNTFKNSFLFRCKFALGKTYEVGYSTQKPPAGYHSISALSSLGSLYNDEFIVYSLEQCTITHLIELEE
jgi:poly [ADP-ribose] polymerase